MLFTEVFFYLRAVIQIVVNPNDVGTNVEELRRFIHCTPSFLLLCHRIDLLCITDGFFRGIVDDDVDDAAIAVVTVMR